MLKAYLIENVPPLLTCGRLNLQMILVLCDSLRVVGHRVDKLASHCTNLSDPSVANTLVARSPDSSVKYIALTRQKAMHCNPIKHLSSAVYLRAIRHLKSLHVWLLTQSQLASAVAGDIRTATQWMASFRFPSSYLLVFLFSCFGIISLASFS